MLHNIANKGHRVIIATLTATLLVALFSTKAHAEHRIPYKSSDTARILIYFSGKTDLGNLKTDLHHSNVKSTEKQFLCPSSLGKLIAANESYRNALETVRIIAGEADESYYGGPFYKLGVDNMLDSETPKLKKLSEGLNSKVIEGLEKALDKTGLMLLDGCSTEWYKCVPVMGGQECYYTVKVLPQDLIKNAEKYLK